MLWLTAAVLSWARWRRDGGASRGWLCLSAVFSGLALGAKYYAGISAALLGIFLIAGWAQGAEKRRRAADLGVFVVLATVLFSPWLIKNAWFVGNPVFPFLYRWFPMTGTGWNAA